MQDSYSKTFADGVKAYELEQVGERRRQVHSTQNEADVPAVGDEPARKKGDPMHSAAEWNMPKDPLSADLVGLAFSGGGIRSGTFNLGILQALGRLKLLTRVDYLSTVSGGGYIGGWLAAWIRRAKEDAPPSRSWRPNWTPVEAVESRLDPRTNRHKFGDHNATSATEPEPETLHHLRAHSRYLAPQFGLFSLDTWTLLAIYTRNLAATSLITVPMLLALAVTIRFVVAAFAAWPPREDYPHNIAWWVFGPFVVLAVLAEGKVRRAFGRVFAEKESGRTEGSTRAVSFGLLGWWGLTAALILMPTLGVWLQGPAPWSSPEGPESRMPGTLRIASASVAQGAAMGGTVIALGELGQHPVPQESVPHVTGCFADSLLAIPQRYYGDYIRGGLFFGTLGLIGGVWGQMGWGRWDWHRLAYVGLTLLHGTVFGLLFAAIINNLLYFDGRNHPALFATFGPPLFLLALVAAGYTETALAGRAFDKYQREWRSRLSAWFLLCAAWWVLLFGAVVYLPWGLHELNEWALGGTGQKVVPWGAFVGWLLTTGLGFFAARKTAARAAGPSLRAIAKGVPVIFLVGLLAIAGEASQRLPGVGTWYRGETPPASGGPKAAGAESHQAPHVRVKAECDPPSIEVRIDCATDHRDPPRDTYRDRMEDRDRVTPGSLLAWLLALLVLTALSVLVVPASRFSLHTLYLNRLTRAYLGASLKDAKSRRGSAGLDPESAPRAANDFTGFDPHDDLPLAALRAKKVDMPERSKGQPYEPYFGPYPIFNTSLNMVAGKELAYQDRKAASFVLTPAFCGSEDTGYAMHSKDDAHALKDLTLGRAIAVSGAAVDPNMRDFQSPQLTAFLSLLNARLGWWIENPRPTICRQLDRITAALAGMTDEEAVAAHRSIFSSCNEVFLSHPLADKSVLDNLNDKTKILEDKTKISKNLRRNPQSQGAPRANGALLDARRAADEAARASVEGAALLLTWSAGSPGFPFAGWPYLREVAGQTDASGGHVHLSDGGHFENTGAYELIRRRCRHVIVIDAAEDVADASENLANLIRLVRTDFGIPIDIDTSPIRKDAAGISKWHCAVGAIRYDEVDPSGVTGTFVFIRPSMTGDEEADLKNYAATNPPFPHDGTANQFFDEAQFESYRQLGFHIGMEVLGGAREAVGEPPQSDNDAEYRGYTRKLFAAVRRNWSALREGSADAYMRSCQDYLKVVGDLRNGEPSRGNPGGALRRISRSLYAEARHLPAGVGASAPDSDPYFTDLHEVDNLLQVMEVAWLGNDFDRAAFHALNRGWMNTFRRWTASSDFERFWPVLRSQYSRGFVRFCEVSLNLPPLPVQWCRIGDPADAHWREILEQFGVEFHREWSSSLLDIDGLASGEQPSYLAKAVANSKVGGKHLAWVITNGRAGEESGPILDEVAWLTGNVPIPEGNAGRARLPLGLVVAFNPKGTREPNAEAAADTPRSLRKPNEEEGNGWELLVWIRGPYRTMGLGRECLFPLLENETNAYKRNLVEGIIPELKAADVGELFVRFPDVSGTPGDRYQRTIWTWFFNDHDFVSKGRDSREADPDAIRLFRGVGADSANQGKKKASPRTGELPEPRGAVATPSSSEGSPHSGGTATAVGDQ